MRRLLWFVLIFSFIACVGFASPAAAQSSESALLSALQWRLIGPFRGGRALAVSGVPGQPYRFYFGAVGGGVWETGNGGRTWSPIFDNQSVASIGALAVAPSNPNVIYVGTGEADMRSDIQQGNGMYKSVDGGETWSHIGLDDSRQIGKIVVDPKDAQTLYVAALGHQYGPNAQRGVFKSTDGGASWTNVLFRDVNTGAIDLAMDPAEPNVLFASLWQTRRPPWNVYPPSNGPGSGLYKTVDGGKTWTHVAGNGFPSSVGHIGISVSPAEHNRIYVIVDTNDPKTGGIYRSGDGGATWSHTDGEQRIWKRGWYFGGITADPRNANEVYVMNTSTYRSTDGGRSFDAIKGAPGGDDYHTLWIDPNDSNRMILGGDQGVVVSVDGAKTWSSWYNQPTAQFYHAATDNRFPYWVYGAQQDSGAMAVPSRTRHRGIGQADWLPIDVGGESGTIAADPLHPAHLYGNPPTYENIDTGWEQDIDPTHKFPDRVWRSTWTLPVAVSPQNRRVVYVSNNVVFRSADGGKTWRIISPDLTRGSNVVPSNLDPATIADSTGLARRGVVYWIAPSPARAHELWAGTDDGYVWITRDEGAHWQNVTPPQVTAWSKVGVIDASRFDPQTAYAAVDRHRLDDNRPYIYRTHDGGMHWTAITDGIPSTQFVNVVREDPKRPGLLYAGTDSTLYVSFDDGAHWQSLKRNLPPASIRDIVFGRDDIVLATHGRSFYILDDAEPLREISAGVAGESAHLFRPAVAYRTRPGSDEGTPLPTDEATAANPPDGAILDYSIERARTPLVLQIIDASGGIAREWASNDKPQAVDAKTLDIPAFWVHPQRPPSAEAGAHRFVWDLHYGSSTEGHRGVGPLAPPGQYAVRMIVNGATYSQPLTLVRDPRYPSSDEDLRRQFALAQNIESEIAQVRASRTAAQSLLKRHGGFLSAAQRAQLDSVIGSAPPTTPDDSVGKPAQDFSSLRFISDALANLENAVEMADARPTPDQYSAFAILRARAASAMRIVEQARSW